ncbi:hypothetical protein BJ508DRAFT_217125, partial [Ascobolus immersus RN42]
MACGRVIDHLIYPASNTPTQPLQPRSVVTGDMNAHHPWWNTPEDGLNERGSARIIDLLFTHKLDLINTPGCGTHMQFSRSKETALDLTFSTPDMRDKVIDWRVDTTSHAGSDHYPIRFEV